MIDRSIRRTGRKMSWSVGDDRPPERYRPRWDVGVKMMKTWLPMSGMLIAGRGVCVYGMT